MGFIDLLNEDRVDMDVVAIKGFAPPDPNFTSASSACPFVACTSTSGR
jgi:hypothetical protein